MVMITVSQLVSYLKTGKDKKREGRLQVMLYAFYAIYFVFTYGLLLMPPEF